MDLSSTAVVEIGRTAYTRRSGRTGLALAAEAVRSALDDAGLTAADVDGITCFSTGDPANPLRVGHAIGVDDIGWAVNTLAVGTRSRRSSPTPRRRSSRARPRSSSCTACSTPTSATAK